MTDRAIPGIVSAPGGLSGIPALRLGAATSLSEYDIWGDASIDAWTCERWDGYPAFYPVYRFQNCYSHSVIPLIRYKGHLSLNDAFVQRVQRNRMNYYSGPDTIDREITRVGGILRSARTLGNAGEYTERIAIAMQADVAAVEDQYPDYEHAVLCGGKDSLNILLLPWRAKVTVLSAAPNFLLVKEFVDRAGLPYKVIELRDDDASTRRDEIVYNACFNNLAHCRWTGELKAFADHVDRKIVFWKGQMADVFTTPSWRSYAHSTTRLQQFYWKRVEGRIRRQGAAKLEQRFFHAVWYRGAMWQGAHMSMLRSVCNALVLSAYHGPAMTQLISEVDMGAAVAEDIRPAIGRILRGADVQYPSRNPGPPPSRFRTGISDPAHFLAAFRDAIGLPIQ